MPKKLYEKSGHVTFGTNEDPTPRTYKVNDLTLTIEGKIENNLLILVAEFDGLQDSPKLRDAIDRFIADLSNIEEAKSITTHWGENGRYSLADALEKGYALLSAQNKAGDSKKKNSKQGIAFDAWQKWQQSIVDNKPIYKTQADFICKEILDPRLVMTDRQALEWIRCWKMGKFYPCRN